MLNDRKLLEKKIQILTKEVSNSNIEQTEALLEAWFRLALHRETPFEKAVRYLKSAYRIDNTNPRYSYHLGRLYFLSGNFDKASHYLRIATEHCPTSHRIWAHIGLLQREIEEKYKGNSSYQKNVLNESATKIDQIIKSGKHEFSKDLLIFEPPPCDTKKDFEEPASSGKINTEKTGTKIIEEKLKQINDIILFYNELIKELHVNIQFSENDSITDTVIKIQTFLEKIIEKDEKIGELFDKVIVPFSDFVCSNETFKSLDDVIDLAERYIHIRKKIFIQIIFCFTETFEHPEKLQDNENMIDLFSELRKDLSKIKRPDWIQKKELVEEKLFQLSKRYGITRISDNNKCRWTGVYDITIENLLNGETSKYIRDNAQKLLEGSDESLNYLELIENHDSRISAFVIIAVEWLIQGYSPAAIKRFILKMQKFSDTPYFKFLFIVIGLFEIPENELPEKLALHLKNNEIPLLLASVIHRNRLLGKEISFPAINKYKAARKLLKGYSNEIEQDSTQDINVKEIKEYIEKITNSLVSLWTSTVTSFEDQIPEKEIVKLDNAIIESLLTRLNNTTEKFIKLKEHCTVLVNDLLSFKVENDADYSLLKINYSRLQDYAKLQIGYATLGLEKIEFIHKQISLLEKPEFEIDIHKIINILKNESLISLKLAIANAKVKSIDKKFNQLSQNFKEEPIEPSEKYSKIKSEAETEINHIKKIFGQVSNSGKSEPYEKNEDLTQNRSTDINSDGEESNVQDHKETINPYSEHIERIKTKTSPLNGKDGLSQMMEIVEEELNIFVHQKLALFDFYSEKHRAELPFKNLKIYFLSQCAELYYRLGFFREAGKLWSQIISIDPLHLCSYKNIAVSDTLNVPDFSYSLLSWKKYLEILYGSDIILKNIVTHADQRIIFHRNYASAFSYGISEKMNRDKKFNMVYTSNFFTGISSFLEFLHHKLLEYLNIRINFNSPTLVLGVPLNADKETKWKGMNAMIDFVEFTSTFLPDKISDDFKEQCISLIKNAYEESLKEENLSLTKNPCYPDEEKELFELIKKSYSLKYNLLDTFNKCISKISDIGFVFHIDTLNFVTNGISEEYIINVTGTMKFDPSWIKVLNNLSAQITYKILESIFKGNNVKNDDDEQISYEPRYDLYKKIESFASNKKLLYSHISPYSKILKQIDDPQQFYPDEILEVIQHENPSEKCINVTKEWIEKYPSITGPVRYLLNSKPDLALLFLNDSISYGLYKPSVNQLIFLKDRIKIPDLLKKNEFLKAREVFVENLNSVDDYYLMDDSFYNYIKGKGLSDESITKLKEYKNDYFLSTNEYDTFLKETISSGDYEHHRDDLINNALNKDIKNQINTLRSIYNVWWEYAGKNVSEFDNIAEFVEDDYNKVIERASASVENVDMDLLIKEKRVFICNAVMQSIGNLDSSEKVSNLVSKMEDIFKEDKDNVSALYYLMMGEYRMGGMYSQENNTVNTKKYCKRAYDHAQLLISKDAEMNMMEQANKIISELDRIRDHIL